MNQFFYETRGKEKVNGAMKEGMESQAYFRSIAPKRGIARHATKLIVLSLLLIGFLGLMLN